MVFSCSCSRVLVCLAFLGGLPQAHRALEGEVSGILDF